MAESGRVKVVVRVRPALKSEVHDDVAVSVPNQDTISVHVQSDSSHRTPTTTHNFSFDRCYSSTTEQESIFEAVGQKLVTHALNGYNSTLFAYGQTGAGKTYTLVGNHNEEVGLLHRLLQRTFEQLEDKNRTEGISFRSFVSYIEIYNECIKDLLKPSLPNDSTKPLEIHHHPKFGMFVPGLSECAVRSVEEATDIFETGLKVRSVAATTMNHQSSRSHCIFTISIVQECADNTCLRAKINVVDLAGSERRNRCGQSSIRLREGIIINSTLSALALVIQSLVQGGTTGKKNFVPFRNSKLTYLLQESLGGNSKTVMLTAVSPMQESVRETLTTLRFAMSVKKVPTRAVKNEQSNQTIVTELQNEIARLKLALKKPGQTSDSTTNLKRSLRSSMLMSARFTDTNTDWGSVRQVFRNSVVTAPVLATVPRLRNISHDRSLCGKIEFSLGISSTDTARQWSEVVVGSNDMCAMQLQGCGIKPVMAMIRTVLCDNTYVVRVTRLDDSRVLVNGRMIDQDTEVTLVQGDRLMFGHAFACVLVMPGEDESHVLDLNQVLSEVEPEFLPEIKHPDIYRSFVDDVLMSLGEAEALQFIDETKRAFSIVAEANEISNAVHGDSEFRFSVVTGSDLFHQMPIFLIRLQYALTGRIQDALWTLPQFYERMHHIRDAYDGGTHSSAPINAWSDPTFAQLLELVNENEKHQTLFSKVPSAIPKLRAVSSTGTDTPTTLKSCDTDDPDDWKEKYEQPISEKVQKKPDDWKEKYLVAQQSLQNTEEGERVARKFEKEWKNRCLKCEEELRKTKILLDDERRERRKNEKFGLEIPWLKNVKLSSDTPLAGPVATFRHPGTVRKLSFKNPNVKSMMVMPPASYQPPRRIVEHDPSVEKLRQLFFSNPQVLDQVAGIVQDMTQEKSPEPVSAKIHGQNMESASPISPVIRSVDITSPARSPVLDPRIGVRPIPVSSTGPNTPSVNSLSCNLGSAMARQPKLSEISIAPRFGPHHIASTNSLHAPVAQLQEVGLKLDLRQLGLRKLGGNSPYHSFRI